MPSLFPQIGPSTGSVSANFPHPAFHPCVSTLPLEGPSLEVREEPCLQHQLGAGSVGEVGGMGARVPGSRSSGKQVRRSGPSGAVGTLKEKSSGKVWVFFYDPWPLAQTPWSPRASSCDQAYSLGSVWVFSISVENLQGLDLLGGPWLRWFRKHRAPVAGPEESALARPWVLHLGGPGIPGPLPTSPQLLKALY